jgi:ubiquinone biosynthesis protein
MNYLVKLAVNYIPELEQYRPAQLVREFSDILRDELNFIKEAHIIERFSRFFRESGDGPGDGFVHIPKVYRHCSERSVLVMEYIEGIKITDVEKLKNSGLDLRTIAENGANLGFKEVFEFGFFHADPHPGNLFVQPGNVIAPVDFGITGYIDEEGIQFIGNVLLGLMERDVDRMVRYLQRYDFIGADVDKRRLKSDLYDLIDMVGDIGISEVDVTATLKSLFTLIRRYKISFPGEYYLILKTILQIDGLGRMLYPSFNVTEAAKPHVKKWLARRYNPKRTLREIYFFLDDLQYYLRTFSAEMGFFMKRIGFGKTRIPLYHENLDRAVSEIDRTGNRMAFAIIIAALLLSSSILVQAKVGPFIRGYPIIGIIGFLTAAVMGLWLLVGIIKSGKL